MITDMKKSCSGCIRLNKKPFASSEAVVPNVLPLSGRHLRTLTGPSKRSSTLKMDMCALSLHSQGAPRDPSELQFPEYHQGLQKNSCTESHPTHHLDRLRV